MEKIESNNFIAVKLGNILSFLIKCFLLYKSCNLFLVKCSEKNQYSVTIDFLDNKITNNLQCKHHYAMTWEYYYFCINSDIDIVILNKNRISYIIYSKFFIRYVILHLELSSFCGKSIRQYCCTSIHSGL